MSKQMSHFKGIAFKLGLIVLKLKVFDLKHLTHFMKISNRIQNSSDYVEPQSTLI